MEALDRKLMDVVNDLDQGGFRHLTTSLVENMDLEVSNSRMVGSDIVIEASKKELEEEIPFIIKFKRGRGKVGPDHIQEIVGKKKNGVDMKPIYITTSEFSNDAQKYADLLNVNLAAGDKFVLLLKEFGLDKGLRETESKKILEVDGNRFLPSIDELENRMRWGNDFFKSSNYKKAVEYYDKALAMKPNYDIAWIMKGNALNAMERYEEASKCFQKAVESNRESEEGWYNLGAALYHLGRFDEELQAYDQALAINPDFIKAWNNKGATLHETGKYEEAILCYDKILNLEPDNLNVLNNKGVALKHLEEYEEALASFERAITVGPDYTDAWINKALLLHEMEEFEDAVKCYNYILDRLRSPELLYQKGIALMSLKKYRYAVEAFDNALLLKPRWKMAIEQKELAEEGMKEHEELRAKEDLLRRQEKEAERRVREEEETERQAELKEARLKAKPETTDEKLADDFKDIMTDDPETAAAERMADLCNQCNTELNIKARFCHNCGTRVVIPSEVELAEAIFCPECETELEEEGVECPRCGHAVGDEDGDLEDLLPDDEDDLDELEPKALEPVGEPEILDHIEDERAEEEELADEARLLESGLILTRLTKHEKALKCFEKAIALDEKPELWLDKGNLLFLMGNHDGAIEAYDRVLKSKPEDTITLLNKQAALEKIGEYDEALAVNSDILEIEDEQPYIWISRARLMMKADKFENAIECFQKALELAPEMVELWNSQGAALLRLGKFDDAILCFDRAIQLDPDFAEAWSNKGTARLSSGKPENSIRYFDRAIDIDPNYARAWANKASALYEMDRVREALSCIDRAIDIEDDPLFFNNKGFLLLGDDDPDDAIDNFDYALELDGDYPEAWNNKGIALKRKGEPVEALECFEKALALSPDFKDAKRNRDATVRAIERKTGKEDEKPEEDHSGIETAEELEEDELISEEFKCPSCGAPGSIEDRFCDECGTKFTAEEKEDAVIEELEELAESDEERKERKAGKGKKSPAKKAAEHQEKHVTKEKFTNELVKVPGVGFSKAGSLYEAGFDSFDKLKETGIDDLAGVSGISEKLARNIKKVYK